MFILCILCSLAFHQSFAEVINILHLLPCMEEAAISCISTRLEITLNLLNQPVYLIQGNLLLGLFDQYLVWGTILDIKLVILKCYYVEHFLRVHVHGACQMRTIYMECSCSYLGQIVEDCYKGESSNQINARCCFENTIDDMEDFGIEKIMLSQTQLQNNGVENNSCRLQRFSERNRDAVDNLYYKANRGPNARGKKIICYVFHFLQSEEVRQKSWTFAIFFIGQYGYSYGFWHVEFHDMSVRSSEKNLKTFSVSDEVKCAFLIIVARVKLNSIYECTINMEKMMMTSKVSNHGMHSKQFLSKEEECLWNICETDLFILQETSIIFQDEETILSLYINLLVKQTLNFNKKPNYTVCLLRKKYRTLSNWHISQVYTHEIILLWRYSLERVIVDADNWKSKRRSDPINTKNRNNNFELLQDISCNMLHANCTDSLQLDIIIKNISFLFALLLMFCKLCIDQCGDITVQIDKYIANLDTGKFTFLRKLRNLFSYCKNKISNTVFQDLCRDGLSRRKTRKSHRGMHLNNNDPSVGFSLYEDNKLRQNEFIQGYEDPWKIPKITENDYKIKSIPWYLRLRPPYFQPFATVIPLSLKEYINEKINTSEEHRSQLMKYEWERYKSFQNFPSSSPVQPIRLAQAGFYYSNVADEVTCFSCGLKCREWRLGDLPNEMHAQMSPACPYISRLSVNIPIAREERVINQDNPPLCSSDAQTHIVEEVDSYCSDITRNSSTDYCTTTLRDSWDDSDGDSDVQSGLPFESSPGHFTLHLQSKDNEGIQKFSDEHRLLCGFGHKEDTPKYPQYSDLRVRVNSFKGWPIYTQQEPKILAEAGLFYTGSRDCVRCFHCGGGLRSWQQNDVPWNEHARWYPHCSFVLRCKGIEFTEKHLCQKESLNVSDATQCSQVLCPNDSGASSSASANTIKENVLHTEPFRTVLYMGFPVDIVQTVVKSLQERQRNRNISVTELLEVLLNEHSTENDLGSASSKQVPMDRSFVRNITKESEETPIRKVKETISYKEEVPESRRKDAATVIDGKESETLATRFSQKDYESIVEENRVLKDQMTCKICMDAEACIVFLPCSHMMTCSQCAPAFRKCPLCRQLIRGTVRAHM